MTLQPANELLAIQFSAGSDTGGCLIRSAKAFHAEAARTKWTIRSMVTSKNYIGYEQDVFFTPSAFAHLYDRADVVILNSILYGHQIYDRGNGKPIVLVHHGLHKGHFDRGFEQVIEDAAKIGANQVGTTVNLELFGPITWVPTPIDVRSLSFERQRRFERENRGPLRVLHCPTDRSIKGTADVITAVNILRMEGLDIELTVLERVNNKEILRAKATFADLYIDQLELGYGVNAVEAWAMGIPVIAGFTGHPDWRAHAVSRYGCGSSTGLPFFEASPETLVEALRAFVESVETRVLWGAIGRVHVNRWHTEAKHVDLLSEVLDRTRNQRTVPSTEMTNVRSLDAKFHEKRAAAERRDYR